MNLSQVFNACGIVCAHIVDDAYDTLPRKAPQDAELQAFLDAATQDDIDGAATALDINVGSGEEAVREALRHVEDFAKLFAAKAVLTERAQEALFGDFERYRQGKRDQTAPLLKLLESAGIACLCFGADYDPVGKQVPQLIFIDLKLNESSPVVDHKDAVRVLETLRTKLPLSKPFVFLMSSLSVELSLQREPFREEAKLFQSEFEPIEKSRFRDAEALTFMLAANTRAMPQIGRLRDSINLVESSMRSAFTNVMKELRALDLADYFVLYHNTAAAEGTTIGSYMVELLLEFLAHEVEGTSAIWDLYKGIETLNVQHLPRARFGLTSPAAKLYSANMLHSTKRLVAEESLNRGPGDGYFYLGDIFCDAKWMNAPFPAKAYAVISPACDIARPDDMAGMNMLLCEGEVTEFKPGEIPNVRDALPVVVMPNQRDAEQSILITWDKSKILIWDDKERAKFRGDECSYVRIGRLRPIYSTQLQHAVTANLSRVGTQRPPSILTPREVRCYVSDGQRWRNIYKSGGRDAGAIAQMADQDDTYLTFILSDPTVMKVLELLATWLQSNPAADKKDTLAKLSGDVVVTALQGFRYKVPRPVGNKHDVTAFPLEKVDGIGQVVGFISSRKVQTPFQGVRNTTKTQKDRETRLLFVFNDELDDDEPPDFDPNAPKQLRTERGTPAALEGGATAGKLHEAAKQGPEPQGEAAARAIGNLKAPGASTTDVAADAARDAIVEIPQARELPALSSSRDNGPDQIV